MAEVVIDDDAPEPYGFADPVLLPYRVITVEEAMEIYGVEIVSPVDSEKPC